MTTVLSDRTPKARKDYACEAAHWLTESGIIYEGQLTFSELRAVVIAKRKKWKILKGEIYCYQANIWDGDFCTFRAIPAIHEICLKHDLYHE